MGFIYGIYIDSLFLTNFLMDMLVLYLIGIFLQRRLRMLRLMLSSAFGSAAGIVLFVTAPDKTFYLIMTHVIVNPIMIRIAFRSDRLLDFIRNWLLCYLFTFLSGGVMQWVNRTLFHGGHMGISILITACAGVGSAFAWERRHAAAGCLYPVTLRIQEGEVELVAYYDTGNLMTDPYLNKPVSIVNRERIQCILEKKPAIRMIPFSSVGQERGLLEAVTVDVLEIGEGRRKVCVESAVIGLTGESLFDGKEYQMILNSRLMR